ncbi:MAG: hypothetical protein JOS17DRAFT_748285 [Linnemannia elongata]|nr:MAG: hypothetical protein JOS17DRAFT_748285 [Linnemannia elongata]
MGSSDGSLLDNCLSRDFSRLDDRGGILGGGWGCSLLGNGSGLLNRSSSLSLSLALCCSLSHGCGGSSGSLFLFLVGLRLLVEEVEREALGQFHRCGGIASCSRSLLCGFLLCGSLSGGLRSNSIISSRCLSLSRGGCSSSGVVDGDLWGSFRSGSISLSGSGTFLTGGGIGSLLSLGLLVTKLLEAAGQLGDPRFLLLVRSSRGWGRVIGVFGGSSLLSCSGGFGRCLLGRGLSRLSSISRCIIRVQDRCIRGLDGGRKRCLRFGRLSCGGGGGINLWGGRDVFVGGGISHYKVFDWVVVLGVVVVIEKGIKRGWKREEEKERKKERGVWRGCKVWVGFA